VLPRNVKPSFIVKYLDQYVIGQDDAKKIVAVAVYSHFRKIARGRVDNTLITKSNVLLIGSSGTGKTLLCATLSNVLDVPFVTAEATSLAQTRYVNEEIEAVLQRLVDKAEGDLGKAQNGIVFIDEIDKLKAIDGEQRGSSGESVQHALLKIMEGSQVKLTDGRYIDTTSILFICGGAFVGLDEIIKSQTHGYGFIATSRGDNQRILDRLNTRVKPTDLFTYGLIPEFTGRLPIIARFHDLDGVGRCYKNLAKDWIGIQRDRRDETVQLTRRKQLLGVILGSAGGLLLLSEYVRTLRRQQRDAQNCNGSCGSHIMPPHGYLVRKIA